MATVSADGEGFNSIEKTMKDTLDRNMSRVHFVNTPNAILQECAEEMATQSRVVVHVDATTMDKETLGTTLDLIQQIWELVQRRGWCTPRTTSTRS